MKRLKVISWNIAGGRKVLSNKRFDYGSEDVSYFVKSIKPLNPDIICFQEIHFKKNSKATSDLVAEMLDGYSVCNYKLSPSHIDNNYFLGMSILSKMDVLGTSNIVYPYPEFSLYFKDGRKAQKHNKGLQIIKNDDFIIGNTQLLPIGIFGHTYTSKDGLFLIEKIITEQLNHLKRPVILCGDFGADYENRFYEVFDKLITTFDFVDSIRNYDTRNFDSSKINKFKTDYIFYSPEFKLINSGVIETQTDHFLCWAEFEYNEL